MALLFQVPVHFINLPFYQPLQWSNYHDLVLLTFTCRVNLTRMALSIYGSNNLSWKRQPKLWQL